MLRTSLNVVLWATPFALACCVQACSNSRSGAPPVTTALAADSGISNPVGLQPIYDASSPQVEQLPCDSTFRAITHVIFDSVGCSRGDCHGPPGPDTPAAGLELTAQHAYANLVGVPARTELQPALKRIAPGDEQASFLYLKVAAALPSGPALPAGAGLPMPLGLPPLSREQLDLLRLWIRAGAPELGVVMGTESMIAACQ